MKTTIGIQFIRQVSVRSRMEIIRGSETPLDLPKLVRIVATEIWSHGKLELIDKHYSETLTGGISGFYPFNGPDDYKHWVRESRTAFPDLEITINRLFINGTIICGTWTATGTHTGEFPILGLKPTNQPVEYDGLVIGRVDNSTVIEEYHAGDYVTMLNQLGVLSQ